MGDRVSISFVQGNEESPVLFSHWGGMGFVQRAQAYAAELVSRKSDSQFSPLDRLEPATVMVDFIREETKFLEEVAGDLYIARTEAEGDNSDNGHHQIALPMKVMLALMVLLWSTVAQAEQVRPHFSRAELCRDQEGCILDEGMLDKLEALRVRVGRPVVITSGFRSREHNAEVGGVKDSLHMTGQAVDLKVPGMAPAQVAEVAAAVGFDGIGTYDRHVHVSVGREGRWTGKSK